MKGNEPKKETEKEKLMENKGTLCTITVNGKTKQRVRKDGLDFVLGLSGKFVD